jgi:hypothetical protein
MIIYEDILIRPMEDTNDDYDLMHAWLSDDRVRQWYGGGERPTRQSIMEKYRLRIHGEPSVCPMLVFTDDGTFLGYVQWYSLGENRY